MAEKIFDDVSKILYNKHFFVPYWKMHINNNEGIASLFAYYENISTIATTKMSNLSSLETMAHLVDFFYLETELVRLFCPIVRNL